MAYFAVPYRILFHDTMAYGSHHFLTNFKFQCEARERLLFGEALDAVGADLSACDEYVFLTQHAEARSLAPARVGERVVILLSIEDATVSTAHFCFRVIRSDGTPISCGYQKVVILSRETRAPAEAPSASRHFELMLRERLSHPSFADRVSSGRMKDVFDEQEIRLAKEFAAAPATQAHPRVVMRPGELWDLRLDGPVLMLPGQGSYRPPLLSEVRSLGEENDKLIRSADEITRSLLGASLLELCDAEREQSVHGFIERNPALVQVAIYLTGSLTARFLLNDGLETSALVGHSLGEISALAASSALEPLRGVEVVCRRTLALAACEGVGGMLALSTSPTRVLPMLEMLRPRRLYLSVINHAGQSVVSGSDPDLQQLGAIARELGISCHRLPARYPFHSPLLEVAAAAFEPTLAELTLSEPSKPVYSPMARAFRQAGGHVVDLSQHLVRRLDFSDSLDELYRRGARVFVECGGGIALSGIAESALRGVTTFSVKEAGGLSQPGALLPALRELVRRMRGSEPNAALAVSEAPAVRKAPASSREIGAQTTPARRAEPIAIVALGCHLPGADDVDLYWSNVAAGHSALVDASELQAQHAQDFIGPPGTPDKTYTLLGGLIDPTRIDVSAAGPRAASWSLSQRLLAHGIAQCRSELSSLPDARRIELIVGSTADGVFELDEALLQLELDQIAEDLDVDPELQQMLRQFTGRAADDISALVPSRAYREVAHALLGDGARSFAVDAACASSLYAVGLGVAALRERRSDLVFASGVFAPGPVNSCLFSQFRGLSSTGSRPFDAGADGVVFSSGSATVALKRLSDALRDGDHVYALISGLGFSSDGKCVSVIEPKLIGQRLAMERGLQSAGATPASVQWLEAHATSTPIGDGVELRAIQEVFGTRTDPLLLGSVKAVIGHTGWVAGTASLIKVCKALEHGSVPLQSNFQTPSDVLREAGGKLVVPTTPAPWRRDEQPRRAGINGFGFGGSNAHVLLEELVTTSARALEPAVGAPELAVVGLNAFFPWDAAANGGLPLNPRDLGLPNGRRVLPEAADQMDSGQFMACQCAARALEPLAGRWESWRDGIGVVLAVEGKTAKGIAAVSRVYSDYVKRGLREQPSTGRSAELANFAERVCQALRGGSASSPYALPGLMPNVIAGRVANLLDLHGPNFIVDAGGDSLCEALRAAASMLALADSDLVLWGGVGSVTGAAAAYMSGEQQRPSAESAVVFAVTSLAFARQQNLPVLARMTLEPEDGRSDRLVKVGHSDMPYLMGAEGAVEVVSAVEACANGVTTAIANRAGRVWLRIAPHEVDGPRVLPAPDAAVEGPNFGGEIRLCAPCWVPFTQVHPPGEPFHTRSVVALVDGPRAAQTIEGIACTVLSPLGANVGCGLEIDLSEESPLRVALDALDLEDVDTILVVKELTDTPVDENWQDPSGGLPLLELGFAMTRRLYERLATGEVVLVTLCTGVGEAERIHPLTGLFGGFSKAVARELPSAVCLAMHTDQPLDAAAFDALDREIARKCSFASGPSEVIIQAGRAGRYVLEQLESATCSESPWPDPGAVVLATGGARGITAELVEELIRCRDVRAILVGRSDPAAIPAEILRMSDEEFARYEAGFYAEELARSPGLRPVEAKARLEQQRSAREVIATLERLKACGGQVEYRIADLTDADDVERLIAAVARDIGRIDVVLHGAGQQVSRRTDRKTMEQFRSVIATKWVGLANLRAAIKRHLATNPDIHLLTSAFSFFGNDGQPDYGAANEALGRLAVRLDGTQSRWTAIAWLGWAAVGMTRGSEYAAVASARRLRPILVNEGRAIFQRFLQGSVTRPNNVLIADGELAFYGVECIPQTRPETERSVWQWRLDASRDEFLSRHLVGGVPTLPGTFEVELAIESALRLRPNLAVISVEEGSFERFVKVPRGRELVLRAPAQVVHEDRDETVVRVELRSDFVHASGAVLQRDVLHFSGIVRLAERRPSQLTSEFGLAFSGGSPVRDPYIDRQAPVFLGEGFRCLRDIRINGSHRIARFEPDPSAALEQISDFKIPSVLLDALCRFAMIWREPGQLPICIPVACQRLLVSPGCNDARLAAEKASVVLRAHAPRIDGERIHNTRAEALTPDGRPLLVVEGLVGRRIGVVPDA
ncbi:MAG TPA: SDR family NAD(P)-dependent oxidoreductase [Polyangiaceae bacterium]